MAGPTPDWTVPNPNNQRKSDLDAIRRDLHPALIAAILAGGGLVPAWETDSTTYVGNNLTSIDWVDVNSGQKLRIDYTYSGSRIQTVSLQWDYNEGAGWEDFSPKTATISYDAQGNIIGVVWA